jgi:hypothetical protein
MRMVFSKSEVAEALAMSAAEFDALRPELEAMGFPIPVKGLLERWSIIQVSQWINRAEDDAWHDDHMVEASSASVIVFRPRPASDIT